MNWTIPGTVLTADRGEAPQLRGRFSAMFLAGGIVLSQVASITGLETYTIQNWVKRGFLTPPQGKRYTLRQLCRVMNINMLKSVFPMEKICGLMGYINGQLDDDSDDMIDDTDLYFHFVVLAAQIHREDSPEALESAIDHALENYHEPVQGAKERVAQVLRVMLTAWVAAQLQKRAETMLAQIEAAG